MTSYKIEHIDYYEHDAILVVDGKRYYFQFPDSEPSIKDALWYLFCEGKVTIK